MSQKTHKIRMMEIIIRRGRTPLKTTHAEVWEETKNKSRSGVEYLSYKRTFVPVYFNIKSN
jgi:hypothetical protein